MPLIASSSLLTTWIHLSANFIFFLWRVARSQT